jgi:hypothetical protein
MRWQPGPCIETLTLMSVISMPPFANHTYSGTSSSFTSKMQKRTPVDEPGYGQS